MCPTSAPESEFPTSKTMWMNRYFRPGGDFFGLPQKSHHYLRDGGLAQGFGFTANLFLTLACPGTQLSRHGIKQTEGSVENQTDATPVGKTVASRGERC
jgi:hypothetical protein